jgi:hypothetical protein
LLAVALAATWIVSPAMGAAIGSSQTRVINGSDVRVINGSDVRVINGSDARVINGSDARVINGSDVRVINGSDRRLMLVGRVNFVGDDFVSVLGQTVFVDRANLGGISVGSAVAVYGSIDIDSGGIRNASVVSMRSAARNASYISGVVDSVDYAKGRAVVSGMTVDYTALLADGFAPNVGDMVSVTGREYRGAGLLVANPEMRLSVR